MHMQLSFLKQTTHIFSMLNIMIKLYFRVDERGEHSAAVDHLQEMQVAC